MATRVSIISERSIGGKMIDVEDFRRIKRRLIQWQGGANCEHIGVDYEIQLLTALISAVENDKNNPVEIQIGKSPVLGVMGDDGKFHPPEKEDNDNT